MVSTKEIFYGVMTVVILVLWHVFFLMPDFLGQTEAELVKGYNQEMHNQTARLK